MPNISPIGGEALMSSPSIVSSQRCPAEEQRIRYRSFLSYFTPEETIASSMSGRPGI